MVKPFCRKYPTVQIATLHNFVSSEVLVTTDLIKLIMFADEK